MWSEQVDMLTEILGFSDEEDMDEKDKSEMSLGGIQRRV